METPSADDARGGSPPAVVSTPATVPRAPRRAAPARKRASPSALAELSVRLFRVEDWCREEGPWIGTPRKKILLQLVAKLDHIHDDLLALREWARIPRPECYPEAPPEPARRPGAEGGHHA